MKCVTVLQAEEAALAHAGDSERGLVHTLLWPSGQHQALRLRAPVSLGQFLPLLHVSPPVLPSVTFVCMHWLQAPVSLGQFLPLLHVSPTVLPSVTFVCMLWLQAPVSLGQFLGILFLGFLSFCLLLLCACLCYFVSLAGAATSIISCRD